MTEKKWWMISGLASALLAGLLTLQWSEMNRYDVSLGQQLIDINAAETYVRENWDEPQMQASPDAQPARRVRTGIFVQSLKFFSSTEVNLTGYIWQFYRDGLDDDIKPAKGEIGFVLPERVDSSDYYDVEAYRRKTYRITPSDEIEQGEVIGWHFEANVRQPFDYALYPFDHKTVWLRMWHKLANNIVLIPDYSSYDATGQNDIFGIEQSIVLETWKRSDTYFNYRPTRYDTDFGVSGLLGKTGFPELHYNIVIQRKFENAFVVHLLPLFLIAALLFGMLLTVSDDDELANRHGFNTSAIIGGCSALFFVVLLAHIQLREQFAGSSVVYLEYFYIVMYVALALSAAYSYLFAQRSLTVFPLSRLKNPLTVKMLFWPGLLAALNVVTAIVQAQ